MRFTKEITLFAPSGTLKRFQGLETSFKIEQGKISALISESELAELRNGNKTMYSRLYSAEQTVDGLNKLYTDVSGKYDAVSGQYTELNTKVAEYKEEIDGFSTSISETYVKKDTLSGYSTTQQMNSAISQKATDIKTEISKTYVAKNMMGEYTKRVKSQIDESANSIQAWVEETSFQDSCQNGDFSEGLHYWTDGGYKTGTVTIGSDADYGHTANISAGNLIGQTIAAGPERITVTFDAKTMTTSGAELTVNGYTKFDLEYDSWKHYSVTFENLDVNTAHTIIFKATKNMASVVITNIKFLENASDYASARIQVFSDRISNVVQKGSVISEINQTAEKVKISASKIAFEGLVTANEYFKINTDGSMEAKSGVIAGWNIGENGFWKDGVEINNSGSIKDMPQFEDSLKTHIYPDGIFSATIEGELIYTSTKYKGYTGTLKVMTGSNTYRNIIVRNGCIVTELV